MALPKIIPALSDLTQDIAGPVPVELLQGWASGSQNLETALQLLEPFQRQGAVVSSDASGLSRLTRERDLVEVMALISWPKEVIHGIGTQIGGRAIGVWVADNTQMFYPADITHEAILEAMNEARLRVSESSEVKVGMCCHSGHFFEIGGGLYGRAAETVESLAENHARADEILVTECFAGGLKDRTAYRFEVRSDLKEQAAGKVFRLASQPRAHHLSGGDMRYPHPFSEEFFRGLQRPHQHKSSDEDTADLSRYLRHYCIVFLANTLSPAEGGDLAELLDKLVSNALMDAIVRRMVSLEKVLQSAGGLAILGFPEVETALEAARGLRERFKENGLAVKIGIDQGPTLVFERTPGAHGVAGDPINISSKISEDIGKPNQIAVTTRAAESLKNLARGESFEAMISNVKLSGILL